MRNPTHLAPFRTAEKISCHVLYSGHASIPPKKGPKKKVCKRVAHARRAMRAALMHAPVRMFTRMPAAATGGGAVVRCGCSRPRHLPFPRRCIDFGRRPAPQERTNCAPRRAALQPVGCVGGFLLILRVYAGDIPRSLGHGTGWLREGQNFGTYGGAFPGN